MSLNKNTSCSEKQFPNEEPNTISNQITRLLQNPILLELENLIWRCKSLEKWIDFSNLPKNINKIVIVWASCSWKTTMIQYVNWKINWIKCRQRIITREPRDGDNLAENRYISKKDFDTEVEQWKIDYHWNRDLGWENTEIYAFPKINNDSNISIYSWNNAIFSNIGWSDFFKDAIIIWIEADFKTKEERLKTRSWDLVQNKPNEVKKRLEGSIYDVANHCHIIVNNYWENVNNSQKDFFYLVNYIWALKWE